MKDNMIKNNTSWKAPKFFMIFVFFSLTIIVLQLVYICVSKKIYGKNMKEFAASRNTYATTLYAKRGTIYDNEGNALALNVSSYTVIAYLNPKRTGSSTIQKHVTDVHKTAEALSPLLNMTVEKLTELLSRTDSEGEPKYQVELGPGGRGISELVKKQIEDLNLPGIDFLETYKRYYPNGDFASYILGYAKSYDTLDEAGNTTTEIVGELGIESKYNDLLTGKNGYLSYLRDRYGYKIPDTDEIRVDALDGADIYLTIDSNIQRFAESAMRNVEKTYSPKWGVIAVMNAKTGEILAASSIPTFDPNVKNIVNYQSPIATYTFEPGSTMKTYSYACAVDSGKYDGNTTVKTGSVIIGDAEVRDWNRVGFGVINLDKGFVYSSNVAASYIVQNIITKSELRDCLDKFGFGVKTGVELANESSGDVSFNYPIEVATASFGQGITTTVLQQLQGMTMFANNGSMVSPRIVDKIVDHNTNEIIYQSELNKTEPLIKSTTVDYMKDLLYKVVNNFDNTTAGWRYKTTGVTIIGKTGTAQIASSTGGYLQGDNDYISSFVGLFPHEHPEIVVYVAIQQPKWGNVNVGVSDAIKAVSNNTAKYLNLTDASISTTSVNLLDMPSYISQDTVSVKAKLKDLNITPIVLGNGSKVIKQYPSIGTKILSTDKVFLLTNDSNYTLPSLIGFSRKDAITLLNMLNVKYSINGTGYVISQDIREGTQINSDMVVNLTLQDKYNLEEVG